MFSPGQQLKISPLRGCVRVCRVFVCMCSCLWTCMCEHESFCCKKGVCLRVGICDCVGELWITQTHKYTSKYFVILLTNSASFELFAEKNICVRFFLNLWVDEFTLQRKGRCEMTLADIELTEFGYFQWSLDLCLNVSQFREAISLVFTTNGIYIHARTNLTERILICLFDVM